MAQEKLGAEGKGAGDTQVVATAPTPAPTPKPERQPLDFVSVRNNGEVKWVGSDYRRADGQEGDTVVGAGDTGRVTYKKALELKRDYDPYAADKIAPGPFDILD